MRSIPIATLKVYHCHIHSVFFLYTMLCRTEMHKYLRIVQWVSFVHLNTAQSTKTTLLLTPTFCENVSVWMTKNYFCIHKSRSISIFLSAITPNYHDDVIRWNHFPCYGPFVRVMHRSPVDSPHKGQWRRALMFSLICAWTNGWANDWFDTPSRHRNVVWNNTGPCQ